MKPEISPLVFFGFTYHDFENYHLPPNLKTRKTYFCFLGFFSKPEKNSFTNPPHSFGSYPSTSRKVDSESVMELLVAIDNSISAKFEILYTKFY